MKKKAKSKNNRGGSRKGAGRKPLAPGGTINWTIRIPVAMSRELDNLRLDRARSEIGREAFELWIKKALRANK